MNEDEDDGIHAEDDNTNCLYEGMELEMTFHDVPTDIYFHGPTFVSAIDKYVFYCSCDLCLEERKADPDWFRKKMDEDGIPSHYRIFSKDEDGVEQEYFL